MFDKVAVLGLGNMGRQIALYLANNNIDVYVYSRRLEKFPVNEENPNIKFVYSFNDIPKCHDVDLIIECVEEDVNIKSELLKKISVELGLFGVKDTILATNTSSIPLDILSHVVMDKTRFLGLHFFNPVDKTNAVEISICKETNYNVVRECSEFIKKINKIPYIVESDVGFVVNRVLFAMISEAMAIKEKHNYTVEFIDSLMKDAANLPIGPFKLMDLIGLDVCLAIFPWFENNTNIKFPMRVEIERLVSSGRLGRKSGSGFYEYKRR